MHNSLILISVVIHGWVNSSYSTIKVSYSAINQRQIIVNYSQ